jgi:transposase
MFHYSVVLNAIQLYNKYKSYNKVALEMSKIKKISRQIISIWYKKYQDILDFLAERIRKTSKYEEQKLVTNIKVEKFIYECVYNDPFITRSLLTLKIKNKFNISYNLNQITKIYKQLKLTYKKPKYRIIKNIEFLDELIKKRLEFVTKIKEEDITKIISIDESGFNKLIQKSKGLSKRGSTIHCPVTSVKNINVSLLMAITTEKIIHHKELTDSVNGDIFFSFIKDVINTLTEEGYIFLFDNVSFHKKKEMLEYITEKGHKYMFTPSYSPNLNPIENVFGIVKQQYYNDQNESSNSSTQKKVVKKIKKVIRNFSNTNTDLMKIFNRAFNYDYTIEEKELRDRLIIIDKHKKEIKENKEKNRKNKTKRELIQEKEEILNKKFPTFNMKIIN